MPTQTNSRIFFSDTTVLYYWLHGHSLQKDEVSRRRHARPLAISNFVRGEYIRGYIVGLIELYAAICEEVSVTDGIVVFLGDQQRRPRRLANALQSATHWLQSQEGSEEKGVTLRRLGTYIVRTLSDLDFQFATRCRDPLACDFGILDFPDEPFDEQALFEFYERCDQIRETPGCKQCEFRTNVLEMIEREGIDLFGNAPQAKYSDHKGFVKQAVGMEQAARSQHDGPSCWYCDRLGDSIIALSAPADACILSGDRQSFPALAEIIGKELDIIPPIHELREQAQR